MTTLQTQAQTGKDISELLIVMIKLINSKLIKDAALLSTMSMRSLDTFNNTNEMIVYINQHYCDSIIIKKNGSKAYTEQIELHKFNGFKINKKSLVVYLKTMAPNGKWDKKIIRFT